MRNMRPGCEQRWYRVYDALCRWKLAEGFCVMWIFASYPVAQNISTCGRVRIVHLREERRRHEQGTGKDL